MPLNPLRTFIAILVALSLVFAPVASAMAAPQMMGGMPAMNAAPADHTEMTAAADMAGMDDCAKMMAQSNLPDKSASDCPCCGDSGKAKCPVSSACLMKCGSQLIAMLAPADVLRVPVLAFDRPGNPAKPPDWSLSPPAPPPRS